MASNTRANSRRKGRRAMGEINMVPFIDVMLVLLTIFMLTAPLITIGEIKLPSAANTGQNSQGQVLTLSIDKDENYTLGNKQNSRLARGSLDTVLAQVQSEQAAAPQTPVVIAADKRLSYEAVLRVMNQLGQAGVAQMTLQLEKTPN